jgi:hypothetical protein
MKRIPYRLGLLLIATLASTQATGRPRKLDRSLAYSCSSSTFLSASASTPNHDAPPTVKLTLIDPAGRAQPRVAGHKLIPTSRYAEVVGAPKHPDRSEVLAVEICNPSQGTYRLQIEETGNQPYRITVRGVAPNISDSEILKHNSESGRIRSYYFAYWIENNEAHIQWLDDAGRPHDPHNPLEIGEW